MKGLWTSIFYFSYMLYNPINSDAVQLNQNNIDSILANNELVVINFYADWCRFSNMLAPIWDEAADKVAQEYPEAGKVVFGKVDCDKESSLGTRFHITKYPTLKYIRNGQVAKREYRGQRSVDAFVNFVKEQTTVPITEYKDLKELNEMDGKKRYLIGYFISEDSIEYKNFKRVSQNLKDDCVFMAGFGEGLYWGALPGPKTQHTEKEIPTKVTERMHPPSQPIVAFRPNKARSNEDDETFDGDLTSYDAFSVWASDKCTPLVREITFENAEELTEEGLPFLILFHNPDDNESIKRYTEIVNKELIGDKQNVNFLVADGVKFAHPLHHLGKSKDDLPLIAIDSFRHMYLFPKFADMEVPGKLKQFLQDLYSGKLHREFHYGPDSTSEEPGAQGNQVGDSQDSNKVKRAVTPPPSQFANLGPSKNRYTLLHDEF